MRFTYRTEKNWRIRCRRGKWHARVGIVGYKVPPSILNPDGVQIIGMVARGARYPYSSVRQNERNKRRYGIPPAGEEWFKNARFIAGRSEGVSTA